MHQICICVLYKDLSTNYVTLSLMVKKKRNLLVVNFIYFHPLSTFYIAKLVIPTFMALRNLSKSPFNIQNQAKINGFTNSYIILTFCIYKKKCRTDYDMN